MVNVADLFCGAGGTSTGCIEALERLGHSVRLTAINHWQIAVATHTANHPDARHLCASLDSLNPRDLFGPGELHVLWASPECTHHSVARGGKPINDQSRATAWCVTRWVDALRPKVVLVENVPDFRTWGPIGADNRPMKSRKGETFKAWIATLESLGYRVDYRVLCAADYGDPTTRKRLFIQAVRGKMDIVWPDPTHSKTGDDGKQKWVPAADVIDWSLEGQSIFERKRALSPKTLRRIEAGLHKFGLRAFTLTTTHGNSGKKNAANWNAHSVDTPLGSVTSASERGLVEPFILAMENGGFVDSINRPLRTVTTARCGAMALVDPFLVHARGQSTACSVDDPAPTVTSTGGGHLALAEPFLVRFHGDHKDRDNSMRCAQSVDHPMGTLTTENRYGLVEAALLPQQSDGRLRLVSEPAPTVATSGAIGLVEPYLVKFYGTGASASVRDPLDTVTAKDWFGLVRPIVEMNGERYLLDIRFRMLQPHELAGAQGFRTDYQFCGNKTQVVKQIGNAVPRNLALALVMAAYGQQSNVQPSNAHPENPSCSPSAALPQPGCRGDE